MSRLLLKVTDRKLIVDHINRDTLDNQKSNLRIATSSQNQWNKTAKPNSTSKYKGVSWSKHYNKWVAYIRANCKAIWIGRFKTEIEAAKAYDEKAKELHGEFACLNFK